MNLRTHTMTRFLFRAALFSVVLTFGVAATVAVAQQLSTKPLINITGYVIDLTVIPATHQLHATAQALQRSMRCRRRPSSCTPR
jgi:hypothetical protein